MSKVVETRSKRTSAEISERTSISAPGLQRYAKFYQERMTERGRTGRAGTEARELDIKEDIKKVMAQLVQARRPHRHVTRGASASEIRKALGISKKELEAVRRDLAALGLGKKSL